MRREGGERERVAHKRGGINAVGSASWVGDATTMEDSFKQCLGVSQIINTEV